MLVVNERLKIPLTEFDFTFARSGGPGGQNVNKVNTKATLRWSVERSPSIPPGVRQRLKSLHRRKFTTEGELVISSQRFRDQGRNVADCLAKLREMLEQAAVVPKVRRPTAPTRAAKERRLQAKRQTAEKKSRRRIPPGD